MATTAGAGAGEGKSLELRLGLPYGWQEGKCLDHLSVLESWWEAEQSGPQLSH